MALSVCVLSKFGGGVGGHLGVWISNEWYSVTNSKRKFVRVTWREAVYISVRGAVQGATEFDNLRRMRAYCARVCAKERVCGETVQVQ